MTRHWNPQALVGFAMLTGLSGQAWGYAAPTTGSCNSATCQVITASSGNLSAQAIFEVNGSDFLVTLVNRSALDLTTPADVLTSLLFNLNYTDLTPVVLSPVSALMNPHGGSTVSFDALTIDAGGSFPGKTCEQAVTVTPQKKGPDIHTCTASNVVGGEWAYASGTAVSDEYTGFTKGIGSAGLDVFGDFNFGGSNLEGPNAVNGGNYGITSAGDNAATDISGMGYNPVTKNAVQFKLTIASAPGKTLDLTKSGALSAGFQYGTSQTNPFLTPAPGTLALLGLGILALGGMRRIQSKARV